MTFLIAFAPYVYNRQSRQEFIRTRKHVKVSSLKSNEIKINSRDEIYKKIFKYFQK